MTDGKDMPLLCRYCPVGAEFCERAGEIAAARGEIPLCPFVEAVVKDLVWRLGKLRER